jgi:hypothetical protein
MQQKNKQKNERRSRRERNYHVVSDALRAGLQRQPGSPSAAESRGAASKHATRGSGTRRRGRDEKGREARQAR